jgi:hypothetical protein
MQCWVSPGVVLMASFLRGRGVALRFVVSVVVGCAVAIFSVADGAARGSGAGRVVPAARVPSAPFVGLSAVSCPSAKACTAVGALYRNTLALSFFSGVPVAERWNGRRWSLQRMPDVPNGQSNGLSVSCPSLSECSVVGSVTISPSGSYPRVSVPLVERWSHGTWSIQRIPRPRGVSLREVHLGDVSCGAPTTCMAVGSSGVRGVPLAERWNGKAWAVERLAGNVQGALTSVSCMSKRACIAVGYNGNRAYAEEWTGSRWSHALMPGRSYLTDDGGSVSGLSCASLAACMAVGSWATSCPSARLARADCLSGALVWRWNGSQWSLRGRNAPEGNAYVAVSCVSVTRCAVLDDSNNLLLSNGGRWVYEPRPYNRNRNVGFSVGGLSCASATACIAVGTTSFYGSVSLPSGSYEIAAKPLAWRWDGRRWVDMSPPNPRSAR